MDYKESFINIYKTHIKRQGADELLNFLEKSDFFEAPASTKFHSAKPGGLVEHSYKVYLRLKDLIQKEPSNIVQNISEETIAICGLLHDVCKVGFYKVEMRNKKNEITDKWEKVPFYVIEDALPYGHGEKSVYMINGYIRLTREEAMAINWHMGGFDARIENGNNTCSKAMELFPLVVFMQTADILATYIDEPRED